MDVIPGYVLFFLFFSIILLIALSVAYTRTSLKQQTHHVWHAYMC